MFENNPFATHTLEIIIMLLGAALIGLWLGWVLWGRLRTELDRLRVENNSLNVTVDALRVELEALKTRALSAESDNLALNNQLTHLGHENTGLREKVAYLESELAESQTRKRQVETELGLSFEPDTPLSDDIPLEIKELVMEPSVSEPAPAPEPEPEVLEFKVAEEASMPMPPVLLVEPTPMTEQKPDKKAKKSAAVSEPAPADSSERDDLTVIEGIGPKLQLLLNQYGIFTYRQLAETDVLRLKEVLSNAGPQLAMHDPGTWPSQANLAANDQWDTLKSVQGFLKGGKKPD